MAYTIAINMKELSSPISLNNVKQDIEDAITASRFVADIQHGKRGTIVLKKIRLKKSKPYCGNHAGACQIPRKNKKGNFLEGADWVAFNDLVNDILDEHELPAVVKSSVCVTRTGYRRRTSYEADKTGEWTMFGETENFCGTIATRSSYPAGTPGLARYTEEED